MKPIGNPTNNMTAGKKMQQHQQQDASYNQNVLQIHQDYNQWKVLVILPPSTELLYNFI